MIKLFLNKAKNSNLNGKKQQNLNLLPIFA
jgi:hypothetical protein